MWRVWRRGAFRCSACPGWAEWYSFRNACCSSGERWQTVKMESMCRAGNGVASDGLVIWEMKLLWVPVTSAILRRMPEGRWSMKSPKGRLVGGDALLPCAASDRHGWHHSPERAALVDASAAGGTENIRMPASSSARSPSGRAAISPQTLTSLSARAHASATRAINSRTAG